MASKDCSVCCLPYTGVKRVRVTCAYCQYEACQDCYRTYITGSMQDAHCMSCRHTWSRDVLAGVFPPTWVNGVYKKHREVILMEREKQLLPESQTLVANYRMAKQYRKTIDDKTNAVIQLKRKTNELIREIWNDRYRAERYEYNGYRGVAAGDEDQVAKKARKEFLCPCPVPECRGFMGSEMECGVCARKACTDCGVLLPLEPDAAGASGSAAAVPHVCDPNVMASFKAIKKQTKPCPKCAVPTFKISGCSQMWCTECQTTWDWNSGDVVKGVIHNPHYFAYMREKSKNGEIPRQPGDGGGPVNCDRQRYPTAWEVSRAIRNVLEKEFVDQNASKTPQYIARESRYAIIQKIQRKLMHVNEVELVHLRRLRARNNDNADLRLKYLIKDISEDEFKVQLQRREKKIEKDVAIQDIYQMACDTGRDALWEFVMACSHVQEAENQEAEKLKATIETTITELEHIREYANKHLYQIRERYKMKVGLI